jgi:hypothetical protein
MGEVVTTKEVIAETPGLERGCPAVRLVFLSMFFSRVLREEWMVVALLLKASKEVPKGSGLIHVCD